jgi:16S rRNA (adenine1518-N6/adenine1519-N6)-dimethyltransferase
MVQREVGERLAAAPGSKIYGATSVLAQLTCDVHVERRVPATVFHPAPRVESALVVLRRERPPVSEPVVALVHAGFAHRRKPLAGSLALAAENARAAADTARAAPDTARELRDAARAALERLGQPADARAERLAPEEFARLAELLGHERLELLVRR